jgi:hypothetical protein
MRVNGLLTKELEQEFEKELYFKMLRWKRKAPKFIKEQLREINLRVPVSTKLKHHIDNYKKMATLKIKRIFKR